MIIVNEGKQRGTLYHFTDEDGLNGIINSGGLYSDFYSYISFTRSFTPPSVGHLEYMYVRFAFDGDKLSNKYKIQPYSDGKFNSGGKEFEEIIKWPHKKLLKAEFALKRIDILKRSEMKDFSEEEMKEYKKIKLPIFFVDKFKPVRWFNYITILNLKG